MSVRRVRAMVRKEIQHIIRDRATFILVLLTPLTMLFIFAYALTVDIDHVPIAVLDHDRSPTSRLFIQRVTEGKDLDLHVHVNSLDQLNRMLLHGDIKAALVIQPSFEADMLAVRGMPIQVVIDGTEPESGTFAVRQISGRAEAFAAELFARWVGTSSLTSLQPIDLSVRALYNPDLRPRIDMVPGLISMMLGFPALSVALALAREREHGTMEQVLVTPVRRAEFLLGKMIPYVLVGLVNVIVMPIAAGLVFHIPFSGSFPLFFSLSAVFLFAIVGMGIVIGVFMQTQPAALALSFLLIFFPGFFMTGIFFPIASMPAEVRMEALSLPGTHFAAITRGIFLTGVGLNVLWPNLVALLAMGIAFTAVAALFFRKRLR